MNPRRLISFDWALKRLLRSKANYEVLEGFLCELLKQDIRILEIMESESNRANARDRSNRVDLKVRNQDREILLIEVQYEREFDFLQRILFSTAKTLTEHLTASEHYARISKVISINILYFDLGQGKDYIYHGRTQFLGVHYHDALRLNDKQQKLFGKHYPHELYPEYYLLKINQFDDITRDSLDEWVYFLKNEEIKEEFQAKGLRKAKEVLDIMNLGEEERSAYEWHVEEMRYQASMYHSSFMDGQLEGEKKGMERGMEQGMEKSRMEMARIIKQAGEPKEKIVHYTQLMPEGVEAL